MNYDIYMVKCEKMDKYCLDWQKIRQVSIENNFMHETKQRITYQDEKQYWIFISYKMKSSWSDIHVWRQIIKKKKPTLTNWVCEYLSAAYTILQRVTTMLSKNWPTNVLDSSNRPSSCRAVCSCMSVSAGGKCLHTACSIRTSQRFSIGLRSGEYAGHSMRAIPSLSR